MNDVSMLMVRVDDLGRVTIPARIRRMLGIKCKECVYISTDGLSVKIVKQDKNELANHIKYIEENANDSENITINEYKILCEIMSKLKGEDE